MKKEGKLITIGAFDLIKGIGMICIVIGHTVSLYSSILPTVSLLMRGLVLGIMPAFFTVSGFGYKRREERKYFRKMAKDLLIPYLWVTVIVAVVFPVIHFLVFHWWPGTFEETVKMVAAFLTGNPRAGKDFLGINLYEANVVWYLLTLFGGLNVLNIIINRVDEKWHIIWVMLSVVVGFVFLKLNIWYFCLPQIFMAVGYIYGGYYIKKRNLFEKMLIWQIFVLSILAVLELIWGEMSFAYGIFKRGIIDYIGAGSIGVLLIFITLRTNRFGGKILESIRKIGRYTYFAMCIHAIEMSCIPWYLFADRFSDRPYLGFFLQSFLRGMIILLGCVVLERFMRHRNRYRKKQ